MKKSMRKILVLCLTLAMLMVNSLNVFAAVSGDFNFKFTFKDDDTNQVVSEVSMTVNGTEGVQQKVDVSSIMPEGYELAPYDFYEGGVDVTPYAEGQNTKEVYVKKVQQTVTTLYLKFVLKDGKEVDSQTLTSTAVGDGWTFMLGKDYQLPEGYKLATGLDYEQKTNIELPCGTTSSAEIVVEPINATVDPVEPAKETVLNIAFETVDGTKVGETTAKTTSTGANGEAWTFMLG